MEIAIRKAENKLKTYNLSGCELYTTTCMKESSTIFPFSLEQDNKDLLYQ